MRLQPPAVTIFLLGVTVGSASGQRLHGHLLDVDSGEPIALGVLELIGEEGTPIAVARTDEDGFFRLAANTAGRFLVKATRLGYRLYIDGPIELQDGDDYQVEFHLRKLPVQLDPIVVSAQPNRQYLSAVGFYQRQRADFGHFVTRDVIARRQPRRMTDLLATVPGVSLVPQARGLGRVEVQMRGSNLSDGGPCRPRVFVDGLIAVQGDASLKDVSRTVGQDQIGEEEGFQGPDRGFDPSIDDVVVPEDIEAIEVYRSADQVPARFGGAGIYGRCGVLVVWTRRGR